MKIAFDIGGVISKYPDQMKALMSALIAGGAEVHIITDMDWRVATKLCKQNGITDILVKQPHPGMFLLSDWVHVADWATHQEMCKSVLCEQWGIDILIDDYEAYLHTGDFIGLQVVPRPALPFSTKDWQWGASERKHRGEEKS